MAMFDDVDKKLSGWFNAGAEKAKGMSETLRLSNAIRAVSADGKIFL